MFEKDNLTDREKEILRSIIHSYLMTAEAVSSKILVESFKLSISSATVRNTMAGLEKKGYIMQPHTSAGRIPTDCGYRLYVQKLMKLRQLTKDEELRIDREYLSKKRELNFVMHQTSKVLSGLTNYTGIVSLPTLNHDSIQEVKVVKLDDFRLIIILIFSNEMVKDRIVTLNDAVADIEVNILAMCLNLYVKGNGIADVKKVLSAQESYVEEKKILKLFNEMIQLDLFAEHKHGIDEIVLEGRGNLVNYPEFRNFERLSEFLRLLDEKVDLRDVLEHSLKSDGVQVYIGKEDKGIEDCSLITASYKIGDAPAGVIGVLGPKRMTYSKVISAVDYVAKRVSSSLTSFFRK